MNIIRKKFVVIILSVFVPIIVFVVFFSSSAMERIIETVGTKAVGSLVELGGANLAMTLTSASLSNLEVTDPDEPMKNAFEAQSIKFSLDGGNLLRRKVIINELSASGIKLNTDRKRSGAVSGKKKKPSKKKTTPTRAEKDLSPDSIVEKEKANIEKAVNKRKEAIEADKIKMEERIKDLPGDKEFKEYKRRADKIKDTERDPMKMLRAAKEIKKLKKDIKRDKKNIKTLSSDVKGVLKKHKDGINNLVDSEVNRMMKKYSPGGVAGELTKSMLSPAISEYVDKALMWSTKFKSQSGEEKVVKPVRASGVDVKFKEHNPTPNFLIKKAGLGLSIPQGEIKGSVTNITVDQKTYGKPIKFDFSGDKLKGIKNISIGGEVNRVNPKKPKDNIDVAISGFELKKVSLGDFILNGSADIVSDTVIKGREFNSTIKIIFNNTKFELPLGAKPSDTTVLLLNALKGVNNFTVNASLSGTIDDYDIDIKSGLDSIAKKVFKGAARSKKKEFEVKLRTALQKEMSGKLDSLKSQVSGISGLDKSLEDKSNRLSLFSK